MSLQFKTEPMDVQRKSVQFGLEKKTWGLFSEMGTGKTKTAIDWIVNAALDPVAVIGRADDVATWIEEIQLHSDLTYCNVVARKGKKHRLIALGGYPANIYLLTYDSVKQLQEHLQKIPWQGVVLDECTEIKHSQTKKTKAVLKVFGRVPFRLAMSGTPVTNSPMDAFSQMLFIDGGQRLGTNFWKFKNKYFWQLPAGYEWIPHKGAYEKLHTLIYQTCIRFTKKDCLELPEKQYLKKYCTMTPAQTRIYKMIKDDFELELKGGEILELNYIVQQFIKLAQVTGGFYYTDDGPVELPCDKLKTLEWMLGLDEFRKTKKIVIWANFNREIEMIKRVAVKLGYHGVLFWKHTGDRPAARRLFRDDPKCQLFIGQAASGIGMNELKVSDTVFYYSRSLKLIHRLQSEDRTHRKGSEIHKRIRYIDLIVENTVDQRIYTMLRRARDVASEIVDGRAALSILS